MHGILIKLEYKRWVIWTRLRALTCEAAELMSDENAQWIEMLRNNTLDLPA